jgi:hypothetical protein
MKVRRESGQATVELLVFLPLVVVAAYAAAAILASQAASERAGEAARAGAMALLQGDPGAAGTPADARAAAAELLRPGERDGITIHGRSVTVRVNPPRPLRLLLPHATMQATADAGPEPSAALIPGPWSSPPAERAPSTPSSPSSASSPSSPSSASSASSASSPSSPSTHSTERAP